MMRSVLLVMCFLAQLAVAEVYKTVDKDGNIKYTDKPNSEKAEK